MYFSLVLLQSKYPPRARFMWPTWVHRGPTGHRWAPCWPHEPCYLGQLSKIVITHPVTDSYYISAYIPQVCFAGSYCPSASEVTRKDIMSIAQGKTEVFPLLMHWRYCSLALNHRYMYTIDYPTTTKYNKTSA